MMPIIMVSETAGCWTKLVAERTRIATCSEMFGFIMLKSSLFRLGREVTRVTNPHASLKFAQVFLYGINESKKFRKDKLILVTQSL